MCTLLDYNTVIKTIMKIALENVTRMSFIKTRLLNLCTKLIIMTGRKYIKMINRMRG